MRCGLETGLAAPQERVEMHHHRKGRGAIPVIGQQDIIFAVADFAGDITAAGLGSGNRQSGKAAQKKHCAKEMGQTAAVHYTHLTLQTNYAV